MAKEKKTLLETLPEDKEGNKILKLPGFIGIAGIFIFIIPAAILIYGLINYNPENIIIQLLLFVLLGSLGMITMLMTFLSRFIITDKELIHISMFGIRKAIIWEEIKVTRFNYMSMDLIIKDDKTKMRCDLYIYGFPVLVRTLENKLGKTLEQLGIPETIEYSIKAWYADPDTPSSPDLLRNPGTDNQTFTYYKGIVLFSYTPFMLSPLMFILAGLAIPTSTDTLRIIMIIPALGIFFFINYLSHCIGLSNDYIFVKNQLLKLKTSYFPLNMVEEVHFDKTSRMPYEITIFTKSYNSYSFYAASLRKRHWISLKEDLEKKGITVVMNSWALKKYYLKKVNTNVDA